MNNHIPRKRFGQNFLKDTHVLQKIAREIGLAPSDHVVEIGPGQGALTRYLLNTVPHLDAVELDRDLVVLLREIFPSEQLTVHAGDALAFDYRQLFTESTPLRIVGNLPYNISTPLLFHLFTYHTIIRDMHFMLQKEVVLRLTAQTGTADYGRLSVMSQYFCDNSYLFTVSPHAFTPAPKVDSAIVRLIPKKTLPLNAAEFAVFSAIVKEAFNYRRKKLTNGLKKFITPELLTTLNISVDARPENISGAEFIRIAQAISVN